MNKIDILIGIILPTFFLLFLLLYTWWTAKKKVEAIENKLTFANEEAKGAKKELIKLRSDHVKLMCETGKFQKIIDKLKEELEEKPLVFLKPTDEIEFKENQRASDIGESSDRSFDMRALQIQLKKLEKELAIANERLSHPGAAHENGR